MKTTTKKAVLAAVLLTSTTVTTLNTAQAGCGGGRSRSVSYGVSQSYYGSVQRFAAPTCHSAPTYQSAPIQHVSPIQSSNEIRQGNVAGQRVSQPTTSPPPATEVSAKAVVKSAPSPIATKNQPTEANALAMLASIGTGDNANTDSQEITTVVSTSSIPTFEPSEPTTDVPSHLGTWTVVLPGNQSVKLVLNADQSFIWTATKGNESNSFSGQFHLAEGKLALVRSNDLQKMEGGWTATQTGFEFKVGSETTGGLQFKRS